MSNEIALRNTPSFAIQTGTKKNPSAFMAPRIGVALTNGKAGREAKSAEKADMPTQAANGGFHTFAGFLAATFPKAAASYEVRRAAAVARCDEDLQDPHMPEENRAYVEAKRAALLQSSTPTNKAGFTEFVRCIVSWADQAVAKPPKLTKAQVEALDLVHQYAAKVAKPAAPTAPEAPAEGEFGTN